MSSGTQLLRLLVNERLAAAAEEIFGLVEKTIAAYEDEAVRSKGEINQLKKQLEELTVLKPEVVLFRADVQSVSEELLPSEQQCVIKMEDFPVLEETEIQEHPQVKEEQVDQCIGPDMEADPSYDAEVRHPKSDPTINSIHVDCIQEIQKALPNLDHEKLMVVVEHLTSAIGVEKKEDLAFVRKDDLQDHLTPMQCCQVIQTFKQRDASVEISGLDDDTPMLIKTKINNDQKYVKISEPSLERFLKAAFMKFCIRPVSEGITVYDETETEVDADAFEELVQQPNPGVFTIRFNHGIVSRRSWVDAKTRSSLKISVRRSDDTMILDKDGSPSRKRQKLDSKAKQVVESALTKKPGGDRILKEYNRAKGLSDSSRRQMVNILAADMTEIHGMAPPRHVREMYACGIVALFPHLKDPYSKHGYEHFYDPDSGSGYLAWRLKTIQRKSSKSEGRRSPRQLTGGGPKARRETSFRPEVALSEEQCREAMSFMKRSTDEAAIKQRMKLTFEFRCKMVMDGERSSEVLTKFPRFKDIRGLIEQDFTLLFGEDVAAKFLERWPTTFKQKVIQQSKALPTSSDLEKLIHCAEAPSYEEEMDDDTLASGWDSDLSSILLLLHLIPPSAQGRKRPGKVSASQAEKCLVMFKESGKSIQEHVDSIKSATQPYLLAVGMKRSTIHGFFIVLDKQVIPCKSTTSLAAFDELFKAHFVFGTTYSQMLHNMYTFIQTTVYNIDVGKVQESPRVVEMRTRMLQ